MKNVDIDKLEDMQNDMLDMKIETEYMNEIMNRNYDVDEDDVDDELAEFER
jgi:charged multivesicular body protein 5